MMSSNYPKGTAAHKGLVACHYCFELVNKGQHHCDFCGASLHLRNRDSIQKTIAWLITSMLFYVPANIYPIMVSYKLGDKEPSTIMGGVILFIEHQSYLVAAIIFIASILIPVAKMLAITWLCYTVKFSKTLYHAELTRLYRVTEFIGKWSMVDVFVVAILVGLVQMGNLMSIVPGVAAIAFSGVVILTMIAAHSFDPRLIWDKLENHE